MILLATLTEEQLRAELSLPEFFEMHCRFIGAYRAVVAGYGLLVIGMN